MLIGVQIPTVLETLTEAGGFGGVPLAQLGAVADVSALQHEACVAAVVEHRALHRRPWRLGRHAPVLQGRPHPRTQQHCEGSEMAQDVSLGEGRKAVKGCLRKGRCRCSLPLSLHHRRN